MNSRHGGRNDDYREPSRHSAGPRASGREPPVDERRRKEPKTRRLEDPMDVDMMDEDSDYDDRRRTGGGRSDKYSSSTRNPTIPATSSRHGRDRTPPYDSGRNIINAIPERDQPRVKPGADRDFWIPADGIDRDVITYEITRYLGQDALVRPGKNEKGQMGYLISAFRAPTTEMIRSMKEASEKYSREIQSSRSRPGSSTQGTECDDVDRLTPDLDNYISSRTAFGRDKDLGQNPEREPEPRRRRGGGGYDSDDSMDMDPPPVGRPYDRDYDRRDRERDREPEPRRGDRHGRDTRDTREIDPRQIPDPRYQDLRVPESRGQDPRYQQDTRDIRDPRDPRMMGDPRLQDPRMLADPRYPDPRYQDSRDIPVTSARHQPYVTTSYQEPPSIPGYTLSPSAQPAGYDYTMAQPRGYSNNTPPPATTRGGQSMYVQPGYPAVAQGPQLTMLDPRTGRLVPVTTGYPQEPRQGNRHNR